MHFARYLGVFGVLTYVRVDSRTVCSLHNFYRQLPHRFRYGQVDGSKQLMENGQAQGLTR